MSAFRQNDPERRAVISALAGLGVLAALRPGLAAEPAATAWARGMHSRVRLVAAGRAAADGPHVASIEISLDKGFKTYWRSPGDSGIPPMFDFAGSQNAADIKVHFPPPVRFDDGAGGHSIGYVTPLLELPVTFRPIDPAKPSRLRLKIDYAVCEKICVPASGQADLGVEPQKAASAQAARLLATLPTVKAMGADSPLAIRRIAKAGQAEHFLVEAAAGGMPELFVEAANPWLFDVKGAATVAPGIARFTVMAIDKDKSPECKGVEATFTLVAGDRAIETTTWLDVSVLSP
jgi:DsbC/DsbD-like thiol-disulfide interchange protein